MKAGIRKSMRVATIFTGVAAATAMGATAADAQITHAATGPSAKTIRGTVRPATAGYAESGSIKEATNCGEVHAQWLHIESGVIGASFCYGYRGDWVPNSETGIVQQCGGTNFGYLFGKDWSISFRPGTTYRWVDHPSLELVHISRWQGTDTCQPI